MVFALADLFEGFFVGGDFEVDFEDGAEDNGEEGEEEVEEGDGPGGPEGLTGTVVEAVCELHDCEHHVLVKGVKDHLADSHIIQPPIV